MKSTNIVLVLGILLIGIGIIGRFIELLRDTSGFHFDKHLILPIISFVLLVMMVWKESRKSNKALPK